MSATTRSSVVSVVRVELTVVPSRSTVIVSAIAKISSRRWPTKMTPIPSRQSRRMMSNSAWTSWGVSEDVGSSRTRSRASSRIAAAISISWSSATDSAPTFRSTDRWSIQAVERRSCCATHARLVDESGPLRRRHTAHEQVLRDREVRKHDRLLVDDGNASTTRVARGLRVDELSVKCDTTGVRAVHAAQDVDQGRLPRPVLAQESVHFPGLDLQPHVVEDDDLIE